MRRSWPFVLALTACGPTGTRLTADPFDDLDVAPAATSASYDLRWHGALIGDAVQRDDGLRLERRERIVVRRGAQAVAHEVALTIERDDARPVRVSLDDGDRASGVATATGAGWAVEVRGEPPIELPWAPPFEDVLAHAVAGGGYRGPALLAGWGFAIADLTVAPTGDGWLATLAIDGGVVTARLRFGADGLPTEIDSGDGVTAIRRPAGVPAPRFDPIEVVDGNALTIDGGAAAVIDFPDARVAIPAVPGQLVWRRPGGGWRVALSAVARGELAPGPSGRDRTGDVDRLTAAVADAVVDDLGTTATTVGAARAATRGDCTTHALQLVAMADDAGIATRVVTGLRLDGDRLVRHRWVVAWTGGRWRAVDPTYGESPAAPALIGLAVHGPRAADLAMADAVVFDGLGARARAAE
ncbi:MAG: hypothetical protein IPH44_12605 [Myxococcales bacterium]|nr:hypothetical protein [Myxococcales bacterium]MBK7194107.1 hypothetical protein [Myxococcales bacterium]MBP6842526.1 hypothetical protein [Kofleriaceae bacterium]